MDNSKKYYYKDIDGQPVGTFSEQEIRNLGLSPYAKVWCKGMEEWCCYKDVFLNQKSIKNKRRNTIIGVSVTVCLLIVVASSFYLIFGNTYAKLKREAYDSNEFYIYVEKYYRDLEYFGIGIVKPRKTIIKFAPMQFFEDTKDYYGLCYGVNDDSIIEIYINEDAWQRLSRAQKYYVMYHELSHDLLNVEDDDGMNATISLMSPMMDINNNMTMDDFIEMSHEFFMNQL